MSMNQSKLQVVKQEMARVNIDILGISEQKWTGMGEFNSDDHYIYYCGDTKGTFHAKMGSIKDKNGMDLTEAGDIKKRWQEYTEEPYKKDQNDLDSYDDVILPPLLNIFCFW